MKYLKVWGCLAKVNIPINKKRKIGPKTIACVFVGYYLHCTTYIFLVVNSKVSKISNNTIMESRDVTFFENVFRLKNKLSKSVCDTSCSSYHVVVMLIRTLFLNLEGVKDLKKLRILVLNFFLFYLKKILKLSMRP